MELNLAKRQLALLTSGSTYVLLVLGQLVLTGETDYQSFYVAPIIFSAALVFILIQKIMNVFTASVFFRKVFFWLALAALTTSTILTFPFWMFNFKL
jgi:hypothetical protein